MKAEDSDTSSWCKSLGRGLATAVKEAVAPQQFGVGVTGGVELYIQGFKIKFERAMQDNRAAAIVTIDVKNAHNSFPRHSAQLAIIEAEKKDSRLIPIAVAAEVTLREPNPIYMCFNLPGTGNIHICDSEKGWGKVMRSRDTSTSSIRTWP